VLVFTFKNHANISIRAGMITNYVSTWFDIMCRVHEGLDQFYFDTRSHFNKFVNSKYKNYLKYFHPLKFPSNINPNFPFVITSQKHNQHNNFHSYKSIFKFTKLIKSQIILQINFIKSHKNNIKFPLNIQQSIHTKHPQILLSYSFSNTFNSILIHLMIYKFLSNFKTKNKLS